MSDPITSIRVYNTVGHLLHSLATDHLLHTWSFLGTIGAAHRVPLRGLGLPHNLTMVSGLKAQSPFAGFAALCWLSVSGINPRRRNTFVLTGIMITGFMDFREGTPNHIFFLAVP